MRWPASPSRYDHLPFFYSDLFELGYEAVGELDSRLETVADWKEPYREGVVYYLRDGRVRGVLLWNVWEQVDAARQLDRRARPVPAGGPQGPAAGLRSGREGIAIPARSRLAYSLKPVPPFRLDLAVWVLRRRPENLIDRWDGRCYRRALALEGGAVEVTVTQTGLAGNAPASGRGGGRAGRLRHAARRHRRPGAVARAAHRPHRVRAVRSP